MLKEKPDQGVYAGWCLIRQQFPTKGTKTPLKLQQSPVHHSWMCEVGFQLERETTAASEQRSTMRLSDQWDSGVFMSNYGWRCIK